MAREGMVSALVTQAYQMVHSHQERTVWRCPQCRRRASLCATLGHGHLATAYLLCCYLVFMWERTLLLELGMLQIF